MRSSLLCFLIIVQVASISLIAWLIKEVDPPKEDITPYPLCSPCQLANLITCLAVQLDLPKADNTPFLIATPAGLPI